MYNYEQSIWGRGTASLNPAKPTAVRLRNALAALKNLPPGSKVLELGAGAGQFIRAVKKQRPDLVCEGTDISETAIAQAKGAQDGVLYSVCKNESLPYKDAEFDAVLVFDVLEHVENPAAVLLQAARVLKSGGILYAFVPCEGDATSFWNLLNKIGLKKDLTKRFAGHIQYFSRKNLLALIGGSGFKTEKVRYSEHFFGQLAGILAFNLMSVAAQKNNLTQLNNESYFEGRKNWLKQAVSAFGNTLIFLESVLLCRAPSPNVHLYGRKI